MPKRSEQPISLAPFPVRCTRFALDSEVPMNLLFILLAIIGGVVISGMPVDVWPDVSLDEATVETIWLGASAEDIERLVTDRIEDKIEDSRGIERIISDSKPDASLIRVKFRENLSETELDASFRALRASVEQISDLPEDAERPVVTKISVGEIFFLLWVAVEDTGGVGEAVLHDIVLRLKPELQAIPGVAKVDDKLVRDREVRVLADHDALRRHGLTLQDLNALLQQYNRNLPTGTIEESSQELTVRAESGVLSPDQLGDIVVVKDAAGGHVRLRDVAKIELGFARKTFDARNNLNECLAVGITKSPEADSRVVAERIAQVVEDFEKTLPSGVGLAIVDDASHIISSRLQVLSSNLLSGIVLVFLVLWAAVGMRVSILAIIGIPFSFCCALICMNAFGITINAISLIGLVLCAGMIVDDAIVVLENIYRQVEEQELLPFDERSLYRAIVDGTSEVFWPVISSSMTTLAAFLPLLLMVGVLGEFITAIPITVAVVLTASLLECLLVLPVHFLAFGRRRPSKKAREKAHAQTNAAPPPLPILRRAYDRTLALALNNRYALPIPLFGLAFLAWQAASLVKVELFPSELQRCLVDLQVHDEASLDQTMEIVRPIEAAVLGLEDNVTGVLTSFGIMVTEDNAIKARNNLAQMHVDLRATSSLGADSTEVAKVLRQRIDQYLAANPDCPLRSYRVWAPRSGPPIGKPVSVRIETPDFRQAKVLAAQLKSTLRDIDGVRGIRDDLDFGRQQLNLRIKEDRASVHGLTFLSLASVLRAANDGVVVSVFKDTNSGEDLDVRLMLADQFRSSLEDLLDVDVRSPVGHVVRVGDIADLTVDNGYAGIPHYDGRRAVTVTGEIDEEVTTSSEVTRELQARLGDELASLSNARVVFGGQFSETGSSFSSLSRSYIVALTLIYFLLATQFRSYVQPLVILCTVPFSWIGVLFGLLLSDYSFTSMTFIAMVGMSGVVVNDSILLVDAANRVRETGDSFMQSLRFACGQRLRPVLLTTITTVIGLAPLALGLGGRSRIWSPFASSFVWGLTFSTLITLFLVPCAYCMAADLSALLRKLWPGDAESDPNAPPQASDAVPAGGGSV